MPQSLGCYIHVPFCVKKCGYCDFYSISDFTLKRKFVSALVAEISMRCPGEPSIDTIYFGGGTPSVLTAREMEVILSCIQGVGQVSSRAEVTMEVNPGTVDDAYLADMRAMGVNRLSIGVQSFYDEKLKFLGRIHTVADATRTVEGARRAGFDNVGVDLIFGIPGETTHSWKKEMDAALLLLPEHFSCYMLTYEPDTPLGNACRDGGVTPLADAEVADLFSLTSCYLKQRGYDHYEVSNYARHSGYRSRHNEKYWSGALYKGFGPASHSFDGMRRSWNHRNVAHYIRLLDSGESPMVEQEVLTREQVMMERVMLGLRRFEGMDIAAFERISGKPFEQQFQAVLARVQDRAWGEISRGRFALNPAGMVYLDTVVGWFVDRIQ